jgi:DNA-binding protein HU-beta
MATKPTKKVAAPKKVVKENVKDVKKVISKRDIIDVVAKNSGMSKVNTESIVSEVITYVGQALKNDQKVQIIGFGTFKLLARAARNGRNPSTGKEIKIPASKTVKFTPGKQLKDEVNAK